MSLIIFVLLLLLESEVDHLATLCNTETAKEAEKMPPVRFKGIAKVACGITSAVKTKYQFNFVPEDTARKDASAQDFANSPDRG